MFSCTTAILLPTAKQTMHALAYRQRWPRCKSACGILAKGKALAEIGQSQHAGHLNLLLLAFPRFGVRTKGQPFACPGLVAIHSCSPAVFGRVRLKIKEAPVVHCCLGDATT